MSPCGRCGAEPTRLYITGRMCAQHTPAALAVHPEPPVSATPYVPQVAPLPIGITILDDRAVASGKRRSNPFERAQAVAREEARKAAHQAVFDEARDQLDRIGEGLAEADVFRDVETLHLPEEDA